MHFFGSKFFRGFTMAIAIANCLLAGCISSASAENFLSDCVVLIVRHAEKPENGTGLTEQGMRRAQTYAHYFDPFTAGSVNTKPELLIASADSDNSERPRLTLEPLSRALGLQVDTRFADHEEKELAVFLTTAPHGKAILIAWHHGKLAKLIRALGGTPDDILPDGQWPSRVYDWVVELRFDHHGILATQKVIHEGF